MTHKQAEQFKAMAKAISALVSQVQALTNDVNYMSAILAEVAVHPALSIPPMTLPSQVLEPA